MSVKEQPNLKKQRKLMCLTQEEASKQTGLSRSYFCMVETGKRIPSVRAAQKIEKIFGIDWHLWFEQPNKKTG